MQISLGSVGAELLARVMMERLIDTVFKKHFAEVIPYGEGLRKLKKKIIEQLSMEEMAATFDNCNSDPQVIVIRLNELFIKKGISMPKNKEELDNF